MAYSSRTAQDINWYLQQGISLEQTFEELGVPTEDQVYYQLADRGTSVEPLVPASEVAKQPESVAVFRPSRDESNFLLPGWAEVDGKDVYVGSDYVSPETAASAAASREQFILKNSRDQYTVNQRNNQSQLANDWRVRITLPPSADYLYKASPISGILKPLLASDGVIFPYTPSISLSYQAQYEKTPLVHSNYQGLFYKSSLVSDISLRGTFTAQDTREASYLLAVIHFFRSATKMFYGKDAQAGMPPPLVELWGLGQYQFEGHRCVIASFEYSLPDNVDYIRITPNDQGQNLGNNLPKQSTSPASTIETIGRRLSSLKDKLTQTSVQPGARGNLTNPGTVVQTVSGTSRTTYVPTRIEINVTLHPIQTRNQVSQQFSLQNFANGNLLRGGFW